MADPMASLEHWRGLFETAPAPAAVRIRKRELSRGGRTFLILPVNRLAAARALGLYPAQTAVARMAKALFRYALHAGLPIGSRGLTLEVDGQCPFLNYLRGAASAEAGAAWDWAMLAGNPRTSGQRCIFLLFDARSRPVAVVKAGQGPEAVNLIQHESRLLKSVAAPAAAVPRLRSTFEAPTLAAFATDFYSGASPAGVPAAQLERVLTSWIQGGPKVPLRQLPPWLSCSVVSSEKVVSPVLFHGDFAPWNIKEANGSWTVLDWERGELRGVPGWDWLHYVVQRGILVERIAVRKLVERLRALLRSPEFQRYARVTGIEGAERQVVEAYLEYIVRVIQPTEGMERNRQLLEAWRSDR